MSQQLTFSSTKISGIYKITNKINGKFYVGQSVDIKRRWKEHKIISREENLSIKKAIKKYGVENFDFSILEECNIEILNQQEEYYISMLNPKYNRTKGGVGAKGHFLSDETKSVLRDKGKLQWVILSDEDKSLRISKNLKGPRKGHLVHDSTREKLRAYNKGKKQSAETIKKRMDTFEKIGHNWINQNREKSIYCIELDKKFISVKQASKDLRIGATSIVHQLKGRQKTAGGHTFLYC